MKMKDFGSIVEAWHRDTLLGAEQISRETGRSIEDCMNNALGITSQIARMRMGLVLLLENSSPNSLKFLVDKSVAEHLIG